MPLYELLPQWSKMLDESRVVGKRMQDERVAAIEKLREEQRLAEIGSTQALPRPFEYYRDDLSGLTVTTRASLSIETEQDALRSRTAPEAREPLDPNMKALMKIGRTAATEFHTQMFVLQRTSIEAHQLKKADRALGDARSRQSRRRSTPKRPKKSL